MGTSSSFMVMVGVLPATPGVERETILCGGRDPDKESCVGEVGTGAAGMRPLEELREQVREAARAAAAHHLAPKPPRASEVTLSQHMDLTNANFMGNVHGGEIMKLIDTAAGIAASRHAGGPVVTASLDQMSFLHPVHVGDVVLVRASVNDVGRTSIEVGVRVESEEIL